MTDRTTSNTAEIGQLAATAGSLLLNEPDAVLRDRLQRAGYDGDSERQLRQLFWDRLGIPQSGLYLPPYAHVFRKRQLIDGVWHFPPARHDGGVAVESVYHTVGFQQHKVPASPLCHGTNIPGDHLGFMLVFVGLALQGMVAADEARPDLNGVIRSFIDQHLGDWVDAFCELLPLTDTGGYLEALADATREAIVLLRGWRASDTADTIPVYVESF